MSWFPPPEGCWPWPSWQPLAAMASSMRSSAIVRYRSDRCQIRGRMPCDREISAPTDERQGKNGYEEGLAEIEKLSYLRD